MINLEITFLGLALALDAAIVSFGLGLCIRNEGLKAKWGRFGLISLIFGLFQGFTLWSGSLVGSFVTFTYLGPLFSYLVSVIFIIIGFKFFTDSLKKEKQNLSWGVGSLILLAFATSMDSFAAGIGLSTIPNAYYSAVWIAMITYLLCLLFSAISHFLEVIPEKWMLRFGSLIFIALGSQLFVENYFKR